MQMHIDFIRKLYADSAGDSTGLLTGVQQLAGQIGWEEALGCLEACVTEKRLAWIDAHLPDLPRNGLPVQAGFHAFFERYLHLSLPRDGQLVENGPQLLRVRWWNPCPTLDACLHLGLDTCRVCKGAYQRPVEALLRRIDPRLRFGRNYAALRPHAPYCEELIYLDGAFTGRAGEDGLHL